MEEVGGMLADCLVVPWECVSTSWGVWVGDNGRLALELHLGQSIIAI